jgi:sugar phosphate isomerase/epimerase
MIRFSSCITNPNIFGAPLEYIMEKFVALGFDGIDIPADAGQYPIAQIQPIVEAFRNKLAIPEITACMNPTRDLMHPTAANRKKAVDYIKLCVDTAVALNVPNTHLCFISTRELLAKEPRLKLESRAVASLQECVRYAQDNGVRILLEPLFKGDNTIINRCEQAVALFSRALKIDPLTFMTKNEEYGLLCDLFHMHREEADFLGALRTYAPIIGHAHVADHSRNLDFTRPDSQFVRQGIEQLRASGYEGFVSFESFDASVNYEGLRQALQIIKQY